MLSIEVQSIMLSITKEGIGYILLIWLVVLVSIGFLSRYFTKIERS